MSILNTLSNVTVNNDRLSVALILLIVKFDVFKVELDIVNAENVVVKS